MDFRSWVIERRQRLLEQRRRQQGNSGGGQQTTQPSGGQASDQTLDAEIRVMTRKQQIESSKPTQEGNSGGAQQTNTQQTTQPKNVPNDVASNQQTNNQEGNAESKQDIEKGKARKGKQQEEKKWFKLVNKSSVPVGYMLVNVTDNSVIKSGTLNPGQSFEEKGIDPSTLELKVYVTNSTKAIKNPSGEIDITNEWISKNLTEYFGNVCVENDSSLPLVLSYYAINYGASRMTNLDPGQKQCITMYKKGGWVAVAVGGNGSMHNLASVDQTPKNGETITLRITDDDVAKALGLRNRAVQLYTTQNGLCDVYAVYTDGKIKTFEWPTYWQDLLGGQERYYDLTQCKNPMPPELAVRYLLGKDKTYTLKYRSGTVYVKDGQIINPQSVTY